MTTEPKLILELTAYQVNTILTALNEAPYRVSAPVIANIMEQAKTAQMTHTDPSPV